MTALKVQNKIFPFACKNISCNKLYPLEDFIQIAIRWGFIYFTNEEYNLIGLTCPNCDFTTLKKYRADSEEFSIKLLENNAPDSDFENNKINVEFKNFVPFSKRILYRVFFQQGDFVPRHINIHLDQFDIDTPLEAELFPEQFDGRYPQAESRDRSNFTIPENIGLLGHDYPKFVKDDLPYSFSEEYLSHLCDIENNQDIKAIPRIVSNYNVYHYSDVWLRSVPNTKLFGDFKEKIYTAFKDAFKFQNVSRFYFEILGPNEIEEYKTVMHSFLGRLKRTENPDFFRKLANFFRVYNMARNTKRYEIMF